MSFFIVSLIPVDDDSWNPWGEEFERKGWQKPHPLPLEPFNRREEERVRPGEHPGEPGDEIDDLDVTDGDQVVEIWGKAALGKDSFTPVAIGSDGYRV